MRSEPRKIFNNHFTFIVLSNADSNANSVARVQNSHAKLSRDPLIPLVDSTSGAVIQILPVDSDAINRMTGKKRASFFRAPYINNIYSSSS